MSWSRKPNGSEPGRSSNTGHARSTFNHYFLYHLCEWSGSYVDPAWETKQKIIGINLNHEQAINLFLIPTTRKNKALS